MDLIIPLYSVLMKLQLDYCASAAVLKYKLEQSNWNKPSGQLQGGFEMM